MVFVPCQKYILPLPYSVQNSHTCAEIDVFANEEYSTRLATWFNDTAEVQYEQ